jgi:hypothetical protein
MKCSPRVTTVSSLVIALAFVATAGCASIISGRRADITIDTYPSNAHVVVHDNNGSPVASLTTPGTVSLKRNRRFFLPAKYTADIDAPGYEHAQVPIRSTVNPWVLGNVVVGGVVGLVVDNATGAVWKPTETEIHRQLEPLAGAIPQPVYSADEPAAPASAIPAAPSHGADRTSTATAPSQSGQSFVRAISAP